MAAALVVGGALVAGVGTTAAPAGLAPVVAQSPAPIGTASWDTICVGYQGCRQQGYSDAGYGANNDRMYWGMYSGHNCTNYVAYRMIRAGGPATRPWSGTGMAYNWGFANSDITDQRPAVGAVAWWNRNTGGIGSSGHVAYVEKIVSANEIIVSEDSWSGDFDWRRITRDSGSWPSGFVHFVDTKTTLNVTPPAVRGTPAVGETLTAAKGRWKPRPVDSFSYQWLAGGKPIAGATDQTFQPTTDDLRSQLSVKVTAKSKGFAATSATSPAVGPVARGELTNQTPPSISGTPTQGEQLQAEPGTWSQQPEKVGYRWYADGQWLRKLHGPTLEVPGRLSGRDLSVTVVVSADGYRKGTAASDEVGPVMLSDVQPAQQPTVDGTPQLGHRLSVDPGSYRPTDAAVTYQWLRDGEKVRGETSRHYDLGRDDLGHRVSVRVTASAPHRHDAVTTVGGDRVTSTSRLKVSATGGKRSAVVDLRISADAVGSPSGTAVVRVGGVRRTVDVVDGRATVRLDHLKPGRATVKVDYAGDGRASAASQTARVRVRR